MNWLDSVVFVSHPQSRCLANRWKYRLDGGGLYAHRCVFMRHFAAGEDDEFPQSLLEALPRHTVTPSCHLVSRL